jgi:formylmethanofuran--tetrahydromethanopterin N-formyltransferase
VEALEKSLLARISQNVLTCPTAACFNQLDTEAPHQPDAPARAYYKLGRKIALFGDGHQRRITRHGRNLWWIPTLGGEFILDRRFGYADGIMGGNLWFMGASEDAAITAAERGVTAIANIPGVITTFPGGIAASASKAGSRYKFLIASTYAEFCPLLKEQLGDTSRVPAGVASIMEIVMNGRDLSTLTRATHAAIDAALETPGLVRITAGNYGGRLGKSFIYLRQGRSQI